jgi:hypothetical protein
MFYLLPNLWKASYTISASTSVDAQQWPSYTMNNLLSCVVTCSSQFPTSSSSSTQENAMALAGNEPHRPSRQRKGSYCWRCRGSPPPLARGDTGTSAVLTRYESVLICSLRQHERTIAEGHVTTQERRLCKIWGFHGGDYEEWCLVGCYAAWLL